VDNGLMGIGAGVAGLSGALRHIQNGLVRSYAMTMLMGIVAMFLFVWMVQR